MAFYIQVSLTDMRNISCMENIIDWLIRPIIHNGTCHNVGFALIYVIYQYRNKILKCIMNICLIMRDPHEVWSNNDEKDDKVEAVKYWAFKTIKGRKCTCHAHNEKYLWKTYPWDMQHLSPVTSTWKWIQNQTNC